METTEEFRYPAKINRPVFRNVLLREKLFSLLEEGSESLVWVSGPAGCGKTTFLSSFIEHKKIPCIWYQMDESDDDPATFFHYLGIARRRQTGEEVKLPPFIPGQPQDVASFTHRFSGIFFPGLPPGLLIVFDGFPNNPKDCILDIVVSSLSRLPSGIRIVITSRGQPPASTASLRLKGQLKSIGAEDMRLDLEEFVRAAALQGVRDMSSGFARTLHGTLEGWYAGLTLMHQALKSVQTDPEPYQTAIRNIEDLDRSGIYELFASEVWQRTEKEMKDFLMRTSFLPQMTAQSARTLTGYGRAGEALGYLCRRNIFTSRSGHHPATYQYHSLFRDFLREKASKTYSRERVRTVKTQAARILKTSGRHEQAASMMKENHDWDDLSRLIVEQASGLLSEGRHRLLLSWIEGIPETKRVCDDQISFLHGLCLLPAAPRKSLPLFVRAMNLAAERGNGEIAFRSWTGAVESVIYESDNFDDMESLLERKKELLEAFHGYSSRRLEAEVATGMLAALVLGRIGDPDVDLWAQKAAALQKEFGDNDRYLIALILSILKDFYLGRRVPMTRTAETTARLIREKEYNQALCPIAHWILGTAAWAAGDLQSSLDHIDMGLEASDKHHVRLWVMQLLGQGTLSALCCQNRDAAEKYLAPMRERLEEASRNDRSIYFYFQGQASFQDGDYYMAMDCAENARELKKLSGNPILVARASLAIAEICCALEKREEAEKQLSSARKIAADTKSSLLLFLCDLVEACILLASGEREKAAHCLERGLKVGQENGILLFWWYNRDALARLMMFSLERGISVDYVRKLIDAHLLKMPGQAPELEAWPWPIKIYSLGRFEILVDGKKIEFHRKTQEKPLALLKAILSFGGREVSSGKLMEALWPDSDGAAAHQALATTLHRLRQLLGVEGAIMFHQGRVTLDPELCWVDSWALERTLGQIAPHLEDKSGTGAGCTEISPRIKESLGLYKGPFLGSEDHHPWALGTRERLRSRYIRSVQRFCFHLESGDENSEAIHWYRKAIEVDSLAEELWQGLIRCNMNLGRKADALAAYKRCRSTLAAALGVEPSEETTKMARRITDGEYRKDKTV